MGYQPQPERSAYSGGTGIPVQNPPIPAQGSLPIPGQPIGGNTEPVAPPVPPQYQPPTMEPAPYRPPSYPKNATSDVPGPKLSESTQTDSKMLDRIVAQVFPGSEGGPGRFSNPYRPTMGMKATTFAGGGLQGGGYQPPQYEGMRGRLAQYSQYVKKNPFSRGQE